MRQFRVVSTDRDIVLRPGVFIIGRGRTADLILLSSSVSRKHAMLRISSDTVSVEDIGSRNGVIVNGERIEEPTDLSDGDCIVIGEERIYLVEGAQPSAKFARPTGPPTREFHPDAELGPDERTVRVDPIGVGSESGATDGSGDVLSMDDVEDPYESMGNDRVTEYPGKPDPT